VLVIEQVSKVDQIMSKAKLVGNESYTAVIKV